MEELEIINAYLSGEKSGIIVTENCFYMPLRITGLGKTIRYDLEKSKEALSEVLKNLVENSYDDDFNKMKEIAKAQNIDDYLFNRYRVIDRKAEDFANDEVLSLYNGLPIIKEHPHNLENESELLKFDNLENNQIIGTIIKPYLKDNEVWGIGKFFDLNILDEMQKYKSTSPAVISYEIETPEGLVEKPKFFNHLALVEKGHWDSVNNEKAIDNEKITINDKDLTMENLVKNDETLEEKVKTIEEVEKQEAENYKEMAKEHENLKTDEKSDKEEKLLTQKIDNEVVETEKEVKADEVSSEKENEKKVDETAETEKEVKADEIEKEAEKDESKANEAETKEEKKEEVKADESEDENSKDEVLADECETKLDSERIKIINDFRKVIDRADESLKLSMPYTEGKRLSPSSVIMKILRGNSKFVGEKYKGLMLDDSNFSNKGNYSLLVDAYNDMLDNIAKAEIRLNKEKSVRDFGYFEPTKNPNVTINKNF